MLGRFFFTETMVILVDVLVGWEVLRVGPRMLGYDRARRWFGGGSARG